MRKYTFTSEEKEEIKAARRKNRNKKIEKRLEALEMRAEGKRNKEISEKTGFHVQYITVLVSQYKANGLSSIIENHGYPFTYSDALAAECPKPPAARSASGRTCLKARRP